MSPVRKLVWRPRAGDRFDSLLRYIADRDERAAERLELRATEALDLARSMPFIGRPGRVAGTRELIVHPNYILVYEVDDLHLRVLRVLHARQQYP
jgi:toxin ParE1/3/4